MPHEKEPPTGLDAAINKHCRGGDEDWKDYERRQHITHVNTQRALDQTRAEALSRFYTQVEKFCVSFSSTIIEACTFATFDYRGRSRKNTTAMCPAEIHFNTLLRTLEMVRNGVPLESLPRVELNAYRATMGHFEDLLRSPSNAASHGISMTIAMAKQSWESVFVAWSKAAEFLVDA